MNKRAESLPVGRRFCGRYAGDARRFGVTTMLRAAAPPTPRAPGSALVETSAAGAYPDQGEDQVEGGRGVLVIRAKSWNTP